jgi:hypothetical protein
VVVSEILDFFEVVRVKSDPKFKEASGKLGYIDGHAFEEVGDPVEAYGVWIYDLNEGWAFDLEDVEPLGHKDELAEAEYKQRSVSLRVSSDGKIL